MTSLRDAAQQALEALEGKRYTACGWRDDCDKAITALRAALEADDGMYGAKALTKAYENGWNAAKAEPVQQGCDHCNSPLYAAVKCRVCGRVTEPAQPQRKPLTEEEIYSLFRTVASPVMFARAIERAHGIGGSDEA